MPKVKQIPRTVRQHVLAHLERVQQEGAYVGRLATTGLDDQGRRQVRDYVSGITRWQRWLDFQIAHHYTGPLRKMEHRLRLVLRIGVYDLLIRQVPPHAALNEAVRLAKQTVRPRAGKLVNAILRALVRQGDDLPQPDTGEAALDLALRYSHPDWMVRRWYSRWGDAATTRLLKHNNTRPRFTLRINPLKTTLAAVQALLTEHEIPWTPTRFLSDAVQVDQLQALLRLDLWAAGLGAIQDEAAALVVDVLDPVAGQRVVDLCAAPGGKALYAGTKMQNIGTLLAVDVHPGRLALVDTAAAAHGLTCIQTQAADARAVQMAQPADAVLLDAPCTGTGVLAKRADLRWRKTETDLAQLTALQAELLDAAVGLVRAGGLLVYSTCSLEPEENEHQITAFLQRHPDFMVEPATGLVPDALVTPEGFYQALPHVQGTDGAFAVRLRHRAS